MKDKFNELFRLSYNIQSGVELTDEESERFVELYDMAKEFISNIKNDYAAECLTKRYINAMTWAEIADDMGQFTEDSVRKCASRTIQRYS